MIAFAIFRALRVLPAFSISRHLFATKAMRLTGAIALTVTLSPGVPLAAQSAHFSGATKALASSGFNLPIGVAVDGAGNVFVADSGNNAVKEIVAAGGYTTIKTLASGFYSPDGVAVDANGNVFVADTDNSAVKEIVAAGGYLTVKYVGAGYSFPGGVAVDGSGNIFVADELNNAVKEVPASCLAGANNPSCMLTLGSGYTTPTGVAVDGSGNIFVAEPSLSLVKEIPASCVAGANNASCMLSVGGGFIHPNGVAVDGSGNVLVVDSNNYVLNEIPASCIAGANDASCVLTLITGIDDLGGVAVNASGRLFATERYGVDELMPAGGSFGSVNVGSTGAKPFSFYFTFDTPTELGSTAVLAQGIKALDFTNPAGGTCTANTAYFAGDTCTVKVAFAPKRPGTRYGAAELLDTAGGLLAIGYSKGNGVGPQVNFAKVTAGGYLPTAQSTLGGGISDPAGMAVDRSGNIFVADPNNNAVKEILVAGGYTTVKTLGSGFNQPNGVAVDGGGNVFVADTFNNAIKEILAAGGYVTVKTLGGVFNTPYGVAVDGSGNVFVADTGSFKVEEILAAGGYTTTNTLGGPLSQPWDVAVDGSGNVFVADYYNNAIHEILAASGYTTSKTLASGFGHPEGVTVDGSGNVFVADYFNNAVKEILAAGGYTTVRILGSGFSSPKGVAVDANGNVFAADNGNGRVVKMGFANPPALSFASSDIGLQSSDSPQKVTVLNIGNGALSFQVPSSGSNPSISAGFKLDAATTCPNLTSSSAAGTLAQAKSCVYAVDFVPAVLGANPGSLTLTDNNLNAAGPTFATQNIALSGKGLDVPFGKLENAVDSVTLSATVSRAHSLKVSGWVGDPTDGSPLGNVKVYIDGTSIGTPTLGIVRSGVAATYGSAYLHSGYSLLYSASSLTLGTHQITVIAINAGGRSTKFGPLTITVVQ